MTDATRRLTRRGLLTHGALGLSAVAATAVLGGSSAAWAGGKPKKPTKEQLAAGKAKRPPATPVKDALSEDERELGELLLHKAKRAVVQAAANPKEAFQPGSLHAIGAAFLLRAGPKRRERAKARATKMLGAPAAAQTEQFGVYAQSNIAEAKVAPAADVQLTAVLRKIKKRRGDKHDAPPKPAPSYQRMEFQLNSVDCIDATHGEWESDELLLGGHLIEPSGKITPIKQWKVSDDFDDGEARQYDFSFCRPLAGAGADPLIDYFRDAGYCPNGGPNDVYRGRKLASSRLEADDWPAAWTIVMVAGEQDSGGFGDLLNEAYKSMKHEIDVALGAIGAAAGTAIGSVIPGLGSIIGAAIGFALGKLVELFMQLFDNPDDFVGSKSWSVKLHDAHKSTIEASADKPLPAPKGVWASPMRTMTMRGDGSHYELHLHWRAFA